MKAILKLVSYIVVSLLVIAFGAYIQIKTSYNMSIVYAYCCYNIIIAIKKWCDHRKSLAEM